MLRRCDVLLPLAALLALLGLLHEGVERASYCNMPWWEVQFLAVGDLPANHRLTAADLRLTAQRDAADRAELEEPLLGKYLRAPVSKECPIVAGSVADAPRLRRLPGRIVLRYSLTRQPFVASLLRPGDRVEICTPKGDTLVCERGLELAAVVGEASTPIALLVVAPTPRLLSSEFIDDSVLVLQSGPS